MRAIRPLALLSAMAAVNDTGSLRKFAYALIQSSGGGTVSSTPIADEGQGWTCTGNLSIPEDREFCR